MTDMRDIRKFVPYIGVGVVIGVALLVLPMIIRGFFFLLLQLMKHPMESLVIMGVALVSYSVGLYLGERNI
jgi:hypothetical protein